MKLRYRRFPIRCPVTFSGDYIFGEGTVMNISQGGWKVQSSNTRIPLGAYLTLQVTLPNQDAPIKVDQAVVRWAQGGEFGLEYLRMQPQEQARLSRFIDTLYEGSQAPDTPAQVSPVHR